MARASTRVTNPRLRGSQRQKAHFRNGAGLVNGFGQAKNTGEELFHRVSDTNSKAYFFFSLHPLVRTEGHPLPGLRSSVRSQP